MLPSRVVAPLSKRYIDDKDDGASGGALPIGAIIGGSVGGVFILGFFVCVCKRLRRRGGGAKMARYEQDADGLLRM